MDPVNATSGSGDQQVMQAQDAMTTPQHAGPVLEGETLGPTYQGPVRADEQPAPVLPNGVPPPVRRTMSDMVEMESLHYSPQANQATPVSDRGSRRYGDEDHCDEASDGTWRRNWEYGCAAGAAATHYVTGELANEQNAAASREGDLPLFGPSARRVMEGWMQRAPLLYPQPSQPGPATDPGSSASIPREMVQEEVRRQVQEALNIQRKSIEDLREENRLLRTQVAAQPLRARAEDD
ncbi:hypothetical protein AK812_SmicGene47921, partial [Symbiodinium microadriaticum]